MLGREILAHEVRILRLARMCSASLWMPGETEKKIRGLGRFPQMKNKEYEEGCSAVNCQFARFLHAPPRQDHVAI